MSNTQFEATEEFANSSHTYLEDLLAIDKYALDDMLIGHPGAYQQIANEYATASSHKDFIDKFLKEVYAQCYQDVKFRAFQEGVKMTEEAVKQKIHLERTYKRANALHSKVYLKFERLKALKESMTARGFMLKDLASLYIAGYFAKDSVTGGNAESLKVDLTRSKIQRRPLTSPKE